MPVRDYDPTLGRFVSADTIVPGAASGAGGGVTTLGYDRNTRLTPLTVNLGEFAEQIGAENREVLQFGAFFQWDKETRQEHNVPMGPANPQALNRYAYCLGNPLGSVYRSGHYWTEIGRRDYTLAEIRQLKDSMQNLEVALGAAAITSGAVDGAAGWLAAVAWGSAIPNTVRIGNNYRGQERQ
jgi:hypothetical protein